MASTTLPPNEELVLTGLIRSALQTSTDWPDAFVSNRLTKRSPGTTPETAPDEDFAVIVRSDGGPRLEHSTFLRRFGIRVIGPDGDDNHIRTSGLARWLVPLLEESWRRSEAIAATRAVSGPHRVPATVGRPEMYLTVELVFVGSPVTT